MKGLKRDMQSIVKSLKSLTQKTEKIAGKLEKLQKAQAVKRPKAKTKANAAKKRVAKKTGRITAIDTVLGIIKKNRSKRGVDTATLKSETGFNDKKIWNTINSLKSQRKIKSGGRGYYVKTMVS